MPQWIGTARRGRRRARARAARAGSRCPDPSRGPSPRPEATPDQGCPAATFRRRDPCPRRSRHGGANPRSRTRGHRAGFPTGSGGRRAGPASPRSGVAPRDRFTRTELVDIASPRRRDPPAGAARSHHRDLGRQAPQRAQVEVIVMLMGKEDEVDLPQGLRMGSGSRPAQRADRSPQGRSVRTRAPSSRNTVVACPRYVSRSVATTRGHYPVRPTARSRPPVGRSVQTVRAIGWVASDRRHRDRRVIRGRIRRTHRGGDEGDELVEIDPGELSGVFAAPGWLRDAGFSAWLLVGVTLFVAGLIWCLSLTHTIFLPLVTAGIIAAVSSPVIAWLQRHRIPRGGRAGLVMIGIIALGIGIFVVIVVGIASEADGLGSALSKAANEIEGWLKDIGVDPGSAEDAKNQASSTVSDSTHALLEGVAGGIESSTSVFFCALTALSLFFLLKDGPGIRAWGERRLGVPVDVGRLIDRPRPPVPAQVLRGGDHRRGLQRCGRRRRGTPSRRPPPRHHRRGHLLRSLRPLRRRLVRRSLLGPDRSGRFGSRRRGRDGGRPAARERGASAADPADRLRAALSLHPLAVLVVTIAGGALFGAIGLILAAPLTSAVVKISADLSLDTAQAEAAGAAPP